MKSTNSLYDMIGEQNTLIITCAECARHFEELPHTVVYACNHYLLLSLDDDEQRALRINFDQLECSQIIVAGHYDCQAHDCASTGDDLEPVSWHLDPLFPNLRQPVIDQTYIKHIAAELNVLQQLRKLMESTFIKSLLEQGTLDLSGVMLDSDSLDVKEIFRNGIIYNDLITAN